MRGSKINKRRGNNKNKSSKLKTNLPNSRLMDRIETPLDTLYNSLERKGLKINKIMKTFNLTKEEALGWCEILENKNLVKLDYPIFGEPILRLKRG